MATKSRKVQTNAFSVLGDALESAAENFEEVTVNARDSAKKAAATARRALSKGVHKSAYGRDLRLRFSDRIVAGGKPLAPRPGGRRARGPGGTGADPRAQGGAPPCARQGQKGFAEQKTEGEQGREGARGEF